MSPSLQVILALCLLIILLRFARRSNEIKKEREKSLKKVHNTSSTLPYRGKYLLTKSEYQFYILLKDICDEHNCLICPKVGLKDLANVTCKENYYHWFNKISAKHVDFVITDCALKPFVAIELDDKSHNRSAVKERDQFKNEFFEAIKLPLFRFKLDYTRETVESVLFSDQAAIHIN